MPEGTSAVKFLRSIRTGETDLTKTLTKLFKSPKKLYSGEAASPYQKLDALNGLKTSDWEANGLRKFMKTQLRAHKPVDEGASSNEIVDKIIAHIEDWPNDSAKNGKEQLRQVLFAVITAAHNDENNHNHKVKFIWKIKHAESEDEEEEILIKGTKADNSDIDIAISEDPGVANGINSLKANSKIEVTFINRWHRVNEAGNQVEVGVGPEE